MPPYLFIPEKRNEDESSPDTFVYPHTFVIREESDASNAVEHGVASAHRTFSKILKKADPKPRKKSR